MTSAFLANELFWLAIGVVLGAAYFFLVGRTVAAIGGSGAWRGVVYSLVLRIGLAAGGFAIAATHGAAALLLTLIGFLIARTVAVAHIKRGL